MATGAGAAVLGSFAGFYYRTGLTKKTKVPDLILALFEDIATVVLTLCAFKMLFG